MLLKMLAACKGAGAAPAYAVEDYFTEASQIALSLHTSDSGHTWSKDTALQNGSVLAVKTSGYCSMIASDNVLSLYEVDAYTATDLQIDSNMKSTGGTNSNYSLIARKTSTNTWYQVGQIVGNIEMWKIVSGTWTKIGTYAYAPGATEYKLTFELIGSALKAYVNDSEIISVTDTSISSAGKVGLWCRSGFGSPASDAGYNDFLVTEL